MSSEDMREVLYKEIAAQHSGIDDFRGKLLGLLPAVAGLTLFFGQVNMSTIPSEFMSAIGVLGALTTLGLLMHELRGIIECYMLWSVGSELEYRLTEPNNATIRPGPFSIKYHMGLNPLVGRETAAVVVYSATIAAWTYLAFLPLKGSWPVTGVAGVAGFVFVAVALFSECSLMRWQHKVEKCGQKLQTGRSRELSHSAS